MRAGSASWRRSRATLHALATATREMASRPNEPGQRGRHRRRISSGAQNDSSQRSKPGASELTMSPLPLLRRLRRSKLRGRLPTLRANSFRPLTTRPSCSRTKRDRLARPSMIRSGTKCSSMRGRQTKACNSARLKNPQIEARWVLAVIDPS